MTNLRHNLTSRLCLYAHDAFQPVKPSLRVRLHLLRTQFKPNMKMTTETCSDAPLLDSVSCPRCSPSPLHFPAIAALRHSPVFDVDRSLLTLKLSTTFLSLCTQAAT